MNEYTGDGITCRGNDATAYDVQYCWLHGVRHLNPNEVATAITLGDRCFSYGGDDKITTSLICPHKFFTMKIQK